jgi:hypothetical protein
MELLSLPIFRKTNSEGLQFIFATCITDGMVQSRVFTKNIIILVRG